MAESLFTSQTPSITDASDGTPGIGTATTVRVATAGTISGIRFYATATVSGTYTAELWQCTAADIPGPGTGTLLASKVGSTPTGGTWNVITFTSAVSVSTGVLYRAVLHNTAGRYVATGGFFGVDLVNGNLTADANGDDPVALGAMEQGTFIINASAGNYPNGGSGTCYFVDVVFTAAGGGATQNAAATLTATGTPTATAAASRVASVSLAGTGTITGTAAAARAAAASLAGSATITAAAARSPGGAASLAATAAITAAASVTRNAAASVAATATITASAATAGGAITHRPDSGTTSRPGSGQTGRPSSGLTLRP